MDTSKTQIMMDIIDEELKWAAFKNKSFQEVAEQVMQSLNDTYKRDVQKEIVNIAKKNLDMDESEVVEFLADRWKRDSIALGRTYRRDLLISKMNGERLTKEDSIRLCYYLEIPFENSKSYKENEFFKYEERFNNVQAFIRNLLLQDELSYRIFHDIFWLLDLSKPINERKGYLSVKLCQERLEEELEEKIESINDFEEFVDFLFKEEGIHRIYICFAEGGKRIGKYYNKIYDFMKTKFGENFEPDSEAKMERIYKQLIDICNKKSLVVEEDKRQDRWEYSLEEMNAKRVIEIKRRNNVKQNIETRVVNDWFSLVESSMKKSIFLLLKKNAEIMDDKSRGTNFIRERIRKKNWDSVEDVKKEVSLLNNKAIEDIKMFAKYSLSLKSVVRKRLELLNEFEGINSRTIHGVFFSEDFIEGELKNNGLLKEFLNNLKLDYSEGTYISRVSAKGQRELLILVTLLLRYKQNSDEFEEDKNEWDDEAEANSYYDYINEELKFWGLRVLDPLNYFDALIIMIIRDRGIDEYLTTVDLSSFKQWKDDSL